VVLAFVPMRGLEQKTALVTGAGGAIGRAISRRLAEEGARVCILDMDAVSAEKSAAIIQQGGGRAISAVADITRYDAIATAVAECERTLGPIDILVNNAGWDRVCNFVDSEPSLWDKVIAINLRGPLNVHHHVVRGMAERGRGSVVNIASDAGRVGSSGEAVYSACKGGIIAFTKTLARELASSGVNLNVVCPGPTETPLFEAFLGEGEQGKKIYESLRRAIPMKRVGHPDDMAGIVAFLASDDARYITGQVISVSGGLTMHG
jgi:2-hydroxycyclohexanecarboxyl-CoA dehydrogenase